MDRKENYQFKYTFSEDEIKEKSKQLARCIQSKGELEDEKKTAVAEFKAKIEAKSAEANLVSSHVNSGYEYVTKTCDVRLNDPIGGKKSFYYEGEKVGEELMVQADFNAQLGD